jgi:hypothetical protein
MPEALRIMFFDELQFKDAFYINVHDRYSALDIGAPFDFRGDFYHFVGNYFMFTETIYGRDFWQAIRNSTENEQIDRIVTEYSKPVILHDGTEASRVDAIKLDQYIYGLDSYALRSECDTTPSGFILSADAVRYYNDDNNKRISHRDKITADPAYIKCGDYYAHHSVTHRHGYGKHFLSGEYIQINSMTHGRAGNGLRFASFEELEQANCVFINANFIDFNIYFPSDSLGIYNCAVSGNTYHEDFSESSRYKFYDTSGTLRDICISSDIQVSPLFTIEGQRFNPVRVENESGRNIRFFSAESAVNAGLEISHCPHCNNQVSQHHDREQCKRDNFKNERYSYHSKRPRYISSRSEFKIGVEIEKESYDGAYHSCYKIYDRLGWVKESDGSLDSRIGYELVSPAFGLFGNNLIKEAEQLEAQFPSLINGNASSACGGHIHFSKARTSGRDTLEMYCGYLPLLYAIYKGRTKQNYCKGMEKDEMKYSSDKYQAVRVLDNRIEFRIFPAVKNLSTLKWRVELLRYMAKNPTASPVKVVNDLCDKRTNLHRLFLQIFSEQTLYKRAIDTLTMAQKYDRNFYNIDFSKQRKAIEKKAYKSAKK